MKILQLIPPVVALAGAAALVLPTATRAYTHTGDVLDIPVRDFRVFNNFSDPEANDNTTPHPQFPGHTGAVMAIWKASVEWGSRLHGSGEGDPSQPGDLGSGGANFDASFQGLATGVGGTNDNIHSEVSGCSGGVIGYVETPSSDGWRIRYCAEYCWDDGPDENISPGCYDLQGVATYLYGIALGMGHSSVPGSTMYPAMTGSGVPARSIEADDIAGIQALYGAAASTKPVVAGVTHWGGLVTITGQGFGATGNDVWFTGVKVTGLTSNHGGTRITMQLPLGAQPGDVLVRAPFTGHGSLSNAWPFDPTGPGCPPPASYCIGAPNSAGAGATMSWIGSTSVAANDLVLQTVGLPPTQFGLFYYGPNQIQIPFGDGFRCVGGGVHRLGVKLSSAGGEASWALDITSPPSPPGQITAGSTWNFQLWYRDPAGPGGSGFNFSDGLNSTFCP